MNITQKVVLELIKSALTDSKGTVPEGFNWDLAVRFATEHKVEVLLFYGICATKPQIPKSVFEKLNAHVLKMVYFDAQQQAELNNIFKSFHENHIDYLPLKGAILKDLYPKREMRYMSDADLLIKDEEYEKIKAVMQDLGYTFVLESNHEYVWKKNLLCVELHKYLIPSYNKDYFEYFGDGWKLAEKDSAGRCKLSDEDFFVYLFTHLAKHYRDSGIGIKQFVDLWIFMSEKSLNYEYIESELKKLKLFEFYENTKELLDVWFLGKSENPKTRTMTEWIFSSGVYGTPEKARFSEVLRRKETTKNDKDHRYLRKIFPSPESMKKRYTVLNKLPFLLPVFWVIRLLYQVLFHPQNVLIQGDALKKLTDENINSHQRLLKEVGLEFDFKE